jgi:hypothetical protein
MLRTIAGKRVKTLAWKSWGGENEGGQQFPSMKSMAETTSLYSKINPKNARRTSILLLLLLLVFTMSRQNIK